MAAAQGAQVHCRSVCSTAHVPRYCSRHGVSNLNFKQAHSTVKAFNNREYQGVGQAWPALMVSHCLNILIHSVDERIIVAYGDSQEPALIPTRTILMTQSDLLSAKSRTYGTVIGILWVRYMNYGRSRYVECG